MKIIFKLINRVVGPIIFFSVLSATANAQSSETIGASNSGNLIKVSHIIDFITVERQGEDSRQIEENEVLSVGDIIRTGSDSAVRIQFSDGTVQTLCANTSYEVLESGVEQDNNSNADVIAAFSRCDVKPRFVGRCFNRSEAFLSDFAKAGQGNKVGSSGNASASTNPFNSSASDSDLSERFSDRCTLGERLFLTFNNIQWPIEPTNSVPTPADQPLTLAETGASSVPTPADQPVTLDEIGASPTL